MTKTNSMWMEETEPTTIDVRDSKFPLSLKKPSETSIVFLNPDHAVTILNYHDIWYEYENEEGKVIKDNKLVLCPAAYGHDCEICEFFNGLDETELKNYRIAGLERKKGWCYTVLHFKDDVVYRTIRISYQKISGKTRKPMDAQEIEKLDSDIKNTKEGPFRDKDSFQYAKIKLSRPDERTAPKIGKLGTIIDYIDPEDFSNVDPLTEEEIIDRFFVSEDPEWQAVVDYGIAAAESQR